MGFGVIGHNSIYEQVSKEFSCSATLVHTTRQLFLLGPVHVYCIRSRFREDIIKINVLNSAWKLRYRVMYVGGMRPFVNRNSSHLVVVID